MIELRMVGRMVRRGLNIAPILAAALYVAGGFEYALSGMIGVAMTLGNLWFSAWIIGSVAERSPKLLLPAGIATFVCALLLLTGAALVLRRFDVVNFPVTGFTLIGTHLLLVLWEGATGSRSTTTIAADKPTARARS